MFHVLARNNEYIWEVYVFMCVYFQIAIHIYFCLIFIYIPTLGGELPFPRIPANKDFGWWSRISENSWWMTSWGTVPSVPICKKITRFTLPETPWNPMEILGLYIKSCQKTVPDLSISLRILEKLEVWIWLGMGIYSLPSIRYKSNTRLIYKYFEVCPFSFICM